MIRYDRVGKQNKAYNMYLLESVVIVTTSVLNEAKKKMADKISMNG